MIVAVRTLVSSDDARESRAVRREVPGSQSVEEAPIAPYGPRHDTAAGR